MGVKGLLYQLLIQLNLKHKFEEQIGILEKGWVNKINIHDLPKNIQIGDGVKFNIEQILRIIIQNMKRIIEEENEEKVLVLIDGGFLSYYFLDFENAHFGGNYKEYMENIQQFLFESILTFPNTEILICFDGPKDVDNVKFNEWKERGKKSFNQINSLYKNYPDIENYKNLKFEKIVKPILTSCVLNYTLQKAINKSKRISFCCSFGEADDQILYFADKESKNKKVVIISSDSDFFTNYKILNNENVEILNFYKRSYGDIETQLFCITLSKLRGLFKLNLKGRPSGWNYTDFVSFEGIVRYSFFKKNDFFEVNYKNQNQRYILILMEEYFDLFYNDLCSMSQNDDFPKDSIETIFDGWKKKDKFLYLLKKCKLKDGFFSMLKRIFSIPTQLNKQKLLVIEEEDENQKSSIEEKVNNGIIISTTFSIVLNKFMISELLFEHKNKYIDLWKKDRLDFYYKAIQFLTKKNPNNDTIKEFIILKNKKICKFIKNNVKIEDTNYKDSPFDIEKLKNNGINEIIFENIFKKLSKLKKKINQAIIIEKQRKNNTTSTSSNCVKKKQKNDFLNFFMENAEI